MCQTELSRLLWTDMTGCWFFSVYIYFPCASVECLSVGVLVCLFVLFCLGPVVNVFFNLIFSGMLQCLFIK